MAMKKSGHELMRNVRDNYKEYDYMKSETFSKKLIQSKAKNGTEKTELDPKLAREPELNVQRVFR